MNYGSSDGVLFGASYFVLEICGNDIKERTKLLVLEIISQMKP